MSDSRACPYCGSTEIPRRAPSLKVCCDTCYDGLPKDLPGIPRFRSEMRWAYSGSGSDPFDLTYAKRERARTLNAAITEYLTSKRSA